jgi:hypothetical protein
LKVEEFKSSRVQKLKSYRVEESVDEGLTLRARGKNTKGVWDWEDRIVWVVLLRP